MTFVMLKKKWILAPAVVVLIGFCYYFYQSSPEQIGTTEVLSSESEFVIHMVTGEFKSKTADGDTLEAYRWDPGTVYIPKGEPAKLSIYGVNGGEHPFVIEGTDVKGTVKKGEETVLHVQFNEEGVYRLICVSHPSIAQNGPMIAYLVVK